jgi:hypothetical protein
MSGQYWDTTFEVGLSTLLAAGDTITVDNVAGGKTSSTSGTTVATTGGLKSTADANGLSAIASGFVQSIASLPDGGSAAAAFTQTASVSQQALASPLA